MTNFFFFFVVAGRMRVPAPGDGVLEMDRTSAKNDLSVRQVGQARELAVFALAQLKLDARLITVEGG